MYPPLLCVCVNFLLMCYCSIAFVWLHTWESFIRTSLQCIHFSKDLAITIIPNIEKYIKVSRVLLDQWTSISLAERTHPVGITHVPRRANVMSGASYATLPQELPYSLQQQCNSAQLVQQTQTQVTQVSENWKSVQGARYLKELLSEHKARWIDLNKGIALIWVEGRGGFISYSRFQGKLLTKRRQVPEKPL